MKDAKPDAVKVGDVVTFKQSTSAMAPSRNPKRINNEKFDVFIEEERETVEVLVFVCGKGVNRHDLPGLAANRTDKRAYLWSRLETEVKGCKVLLGEHDFLIRAYGNILQKNKNPSRVNLAKFEAVLARHVDLVVLFPESAGSFAELGLFTAPGGIAESLFVMIEKKYEGEASFLESFLWRGPIASVASERGRVGFFDYQDLEGIYDAVREVVDDLVEKFTAEKAFIRSKL